MPVAPDAHQTHSHACVRDRVGGPAPTMARSARANRIVCAGEPRTDSPAALAALAALLIELAALLIELATRIGDGARRLAWLTQRMLVRLRAVPRRLPMSPAFSGYA